jgi:hypothetical protein
MLPQLQWCSDLGAHCAGEKYDYGQLTLLLACTSLGGAASSPLLAFPAVIASLYIFFIAIAFRCRFAINRSLYGMCILAGTRDEFDLGY